MVEWILVNNYQIPDLLHYLDDFITASPPDSPQCALNLRTALRVCECLGLHLPVGKCMGHFPVMTVLGIQLDSLAQVAHLLMTRCWPYRIWFSHGCLGNGVPDRISNASLVTSIMQLNLFRLAVHFFAR